ncbi:MAG: hypothetical protein ISR65_13380 [Bacteriovoracaceae bacterium]|nr:hypothetical protein [Bacteriovoracaceae bacterium]
MCVKINKKKFITGFSVAKKFLVLNLLIVISVIISSCVEYTEVSTPYTSGRSGLINRIKGEFRQDLVGGGLTGQQANIISDQAAQNAKNGGTPANAYTVNAAVSSKTVSSKTVSSSVAPSSRYSSNIKKVLPRMLEGAMEALAFDSMHFASGTHKMLAAGLISKSLITSGVKRRHHLQNREFTELVEDLSYSSMRNLTSSGFMGDDLIGAVGHVSDEISKLMPMYFFDDFMLRKLSGVSSSGMARGIDFLDISTEQKGLAIKSAVFETISNLSGISGSDDFKISIMDEINSSIMATIGSFNKSSEDSSKLISELVQGSVTGLAQVNLPTDKIQGAFESINDEVTKSLSSMPSFGPNSLDTLITSINQGSMTGLMNSQLDANQLALALEGLSSGLVSQLENAGVASTKINEVLEDIVTKAVKSSESLNMDVQAAVNDHRRCSFIYFQS